MTPMPDFLDHNIYVLICFHTQRALQSDDEQPREGRSFQQPCAGRSDAQFSFPKPDSLLGIDGGMGDAQRQKPQEALRAILLVSPGPPVSGRQ